MSERKIASVKDNKDKQRTYAKQKARYCSAMKYGFYLEAMMIDYALLEDRLRSVLYHIGFLPNRRSTSVWKKARPYFTEIVKQYKTEKENDALGITNISSKIKIVRSILLWVANTEGGYQDNKHLVLLKSRFEELDIDAFLCTIKEIEEWCSYRNEIVHALMNKNLESIELELKEKAEAGMRLANYIDSQERMIKKGNKIRKGINLVIEK